MVACVPSPLPLAMSVPEELSDQGDINQDIVGRNNDLPTGLSREQRAHQVRRIAQTPFNEEESRETSGRLELVVLIYLGDLSKQP